VPVTHLAKHKRQRHCAGPVVIETLVFLAYAASHPARMQTPASPPAAPATRRKTFDGVVPTRSRPEPSATPAM
jgi:hypothetical protein